jgi:4-hydroxybenzoate polyprenyltransferase
MATSVYQINKGINKPIEFKGYKAQYILYLGIGLVLLLILFAILYIAGLHPFACLAIIGVLGGVLFSAVRHLSKRYGPYGLMKKIAKRRIPKQVWSNSRNIFIGSINKREDGKETV